MTKRSRPLHGLMRCTHCVALLLGVLGPVHAVFAQSVTGEAGGEERSLDFVAPWPPWVTILLILLSAGLVFALYARESTDSPSWVRWVLATIRLSLIGLVLWMMYGFTERPFRTDLPDLLVILDNSPSMSTVDAYAGQEALNGAIENDLQELNIDGASRLHLAKSVLLRRDAELLEFLKKNYQPKFISLSNQIDSEVELQSSIVGQEVVGDQSRLGETLRNALRRQRGRPVAAVLYLTDGVVTEGPLLSEVAREAGQRKIPLHIVGLGSRLPARDIRLADLVVNEAVFLGDVITFDMKLLANGYADQQVVVTVRRADESGTPETRRVKLGSQQETIPLRLGVKAEEKGTIDFVVEVSPREGELTAENNRLEARVEVRDEKTRVLLVQGYPSYEFNYLRTLLQRASAEGPSQGRGDVLGESQSRAIELRILLQDADPEYVDIDEFALRGFPTREELFAYDVCIFGDVNPAFLRSSALKDLRDFVMQRGRGFIGIAGPRYFPSAYQSTDLAAVLPFDVRNALSPPPDLPIVEGYRPRITALGQTMPAMQLALDPTLNAERWSDLPELYWFLATNSLKLGTQTLAEHPDRLGADGVALPVLTLSYAGAGKVLFHYTDDSWRWRIGKGDQVFGRYWLQSIRYLSRFKLGEGRDVRLTTDRETYNRGEAVRLRSRFFDDRLAPQEDEGVSVMVERDGGRKQQVKLNRETTQRGTFSADATGLRPGKYHAWISEPVFDGESPSVDFEIVSPDTELTRLQIDVPEMELAAKLSGGEFYNYLTAATLPSKLPVGKQVRIESLTPEPFWNAWPVALAFVALLVSEWLLRRRVGML